jgi:DNA-binding transcriptional MerR regulator
VSRRLPRGPERAHDGLCQRAGITYRQLDTWVRKGLVPGAVVTPGQGRHRVFSPEGERRVVTLGRLTRAGFTLAKAVEIAPRMEDDRGAHLLHDGITITWVDPWPNVS